MFFQWSLSDHKSTQVSRTLLSNLAVLNNAEIWMVSTRPPTSKSSIIIIIIIIITLLFAIFSHQQTLIDFARGLVTASLLRSSGLFGELCSISARLE